MWPALSYKSIMVEGSSAGLSTEGCLGVKLVEGVWGEDSGHLRRKGHGERATAGGTWRGNQGEISRLWEF